MSAISLPDGAEALKAELKLGDIMRLIERTARWVDPETFDLLPVWYPEHARRALFYKGNWTEPQMNINRKTEVSVHKMEGNTNANKGLTLALGLRPDGRKTGPVAIFGVSMTLPIRKRTSSYRITVFILVSPTWCCYRHRLKHLRIQCLT